MKKLTTATISAIATPPGHGGIGVIRISGELALAILRKLLVAPNGSTFHVEPRHAIVGLVTAVSGDVLDRGVGVFFKGPNSYTGEDVAEISCHGNPLLLAKILQETWKAGACPAARGEFAMRAFLNGKMDLVQAEATLGMINATSMDQVLTSSRALMGLVSKRVRTIEDKLEDILVNIDAQIDFPEEELSLKTRKELTVASESCVCDLEEMAEAFDQGRIKATEPVIVLGGLPNAGKSSLFNALLENQRAIVSSTPGTTRDFIEETLFFEEGSARLCDTAGIVEKPVNDIEHATGLSTREALSRADLLILVHEVPLLPSEEEVAILRQFGVERCVIAVTKIDLGDPSEVVSSFRRQFREASVVLASIMVSNGTQELRKTIEAWVISRGRQSSDLLLVSARQRHEVGEAAGCVRKAISSLQSGESEDCVAENVREAFERVRSILGKDCQPDVLAEIFSRFCIGK